jgi:hypothetical protein
MVYATELIIYDVLNNYKFYILQKNGFVNITKICQDYGVRFEDWQEQYYQPLLEPYQRLCDLYTLQEKFPLQEYGGNLYMEISMAFHFIYWVSFNLGIGFCANIIPFLCEYFKE